MPFPKKISALLVDKANPLFSLAHRLVPNKLQKHAVLFAINHLAKEFNEQGDLDFMHGKVAKVEIKDIGVSWYFTKTEFSSISMLVATDIKEDVTFSGTLNAMVLMASQRVDPDTLFFSRQLQILGDTELGLEIKNLIDQFDISQLASPVRSLLNTWADALTNEPQLAT